MARATDECPCGRELTACSVPVTTNIFLDEVIRAFEFLARRLPAEMIERRQLMEIQRALNTMTDRMCEHQLCEYLNVEFLKKGVDDGCTFKEQYLGTWEISSHGDISNGGTSTSRGEYDSQ